MRRSSASAEATAGQVGRRYGLPFRRKLGGGGDDASGDKTECGALCFFRRGRAGFVVFGVLVNLPEIVELSVSQNIFGAQHGGHHGVVLVVVFVHAVAADEMQIWITVFQFLANRRDRKSTRLNSSHVSESRMPSS